MRTTEQNRAYMVRYREKNRERLREYKLFMRSWRKSRKIERNVSNPV